MLADLFFAASCQEWPGCAAGAWRFATCMLRPVAVTEFNFQQAENLIGRYGFNYRPPLSRRLQLAVALDLCEQGVVETIVAADKTLIEVAANEGLSVLNPTG